MAASGWPAPAVQTVLEVLRAGSRLDAKPVDDFLVRGLIQKLPSLLSEKIGVRQLADLAHLSPSRLQHRFARHTGMAVRPYLLWLRLLTAIAAIGRNTTLTDAAVEAGFADSAHFSRTFRRRFGFAPRQLLHPTFIRYASFPLIEGGAVLLIVVLASQGVAYWPAFPVLVLAAVALLAVAERLRPYESAWNEDHDGDTLIDAMHLFLNQVLIQSSVALAYVLRDVFPYRVTFWPDTAPIWVQVLLAGAVIDLGLYAMHRYSHKSAFLWRLHKLHHSPERIYWMNGGRRHPVSALIMAAPSLSLLVLLGATPMAVAAWMAILSIHLCFQHSNLDYSLGPLRHVFCVAENHRWHHKRQFEDAQVNFGEVWAVWDWLFGTYFDATASPRAGEVGLIDTTVPPTYLGQLAWPFRKPESTNPPAA